MKTIMSVLLLLFVIITAVSCSREFDQLRKIVFVRSSQIWTMNEDGSGEEQLTTSGTNNSPSWSPDGEQIVFSQFNSGTYTIWTMYKDGSDQKCIFTAPSGYMAQFPTYSPNGKKIAIIYRVTSASPRSVMIINDDGSGSPETIYAISGSNDAFLFYPSWSPDGNWIYVVYAYTVAPIEYTVRKISTDPPYNVTPSASITNTSAMIYISFSPYGSDLAVYNSGMVQIWDVYTEVLKYTIAAASSSADTPGWSLDEESLIFTDTAGYICTVDNNLTGSNLKQLVPGTSPSFQSKPR